MAKIHRQALVPYSATQMYQLVNDVAEYPNFVPHCKAVKLVSSTDEEIVATLELDAGPIASQFTTRNTLLKNEQVVMKLEDGPFTFLHGVWEFTQLGDEGSKVQFQLEFDFTHKLASLAFGRVFKKMTEKMFDAFLQRAKQRFE